MQVLILGLPRTGTQSLADALAILGISPIYHMREVGKNNHADLWTALIYEKFEKDGSPQPSGDLLTILSNYQGVADYPAAIFVDELLAAFPKADVVLTVRPEDVWAKSMKDTIVHYLEHRVSDETTPMAVMSRTYSKFCWDDDFEKNGLDLFRRHNEHVRLAAKDRNFLEYTVGDGWKPLCDFLKTSVPDDIPFPRKDDWLKYKRQIHKIISLNYIS
ncbi:nad dependent epimerase [Fusarium sp. NRRL 52700]|nr:nad dependent epimerase [Fusarium sp. NRRL 52700]